MDHLLEPLNPTRRRPRVQYIAQSYDGGSFLDYPDRHPSQLAAGSEQFNSFIQTWLYFGLLHTVLGPALDLRNYIGEDDLGRVVRSHSLHRDLEHWVAQARLWDRRRQDEVIGHVVACLEKCSVFLLYSHQSDLIIRQSIAALGEAIVSAIGLASHLDVVFSSVWVAVFADAGIHEHMQSHGWCPAEAFWASESFRTVDALYFVERLPKPDPSHKHRDCTRQLCSGAQTNLDTYQPQHVGPCECDSIGPAIEDVMYCINQSSYPVLRVTGNSISEIAVEPLPFQEGMKYTALSHVWSDGLGNPAAMRLPRCQVLRLKRIITHLREQTSSASITEEQQRRHEILIWCDSLCCPVQPHLKQPALAKMRDVYQNAANVLVLDHSLQQYSVAEIGIREATFRLLTSTWMSRLWTLQEAALAKNLWIQYCDQAIDINRIIAAARRDFREHMSTRSSYIDVWRKLSALRPFIQVTADDVHERRQERLHLAEAAEAVRFRRASVPSDEPLCLATLLRLDLTFLTRVPPGDRMMMFWKLVSHTQEGIPKDVIFSELPRLSQKGFRWAAASLIDQKGENWRVLTAMEDNSSPEFKGTVTQDGLRVQHPAWSLCMAISTDERLINLPSSFQVFSNKIQLRHRDGQWYELTYLGEEEELPAPNLWDSYTTLQSSILLRNHSAEQDDIGGRDALFASIRKSIGTSIAVRSDLVVTVRRITHGDDSVWESAIAPGLVLRDEMATFVRTRTLTATELSATFARRARELASQILDQDPGLVETRSNPRTGFFTREPLARIATAVAVICVGRYLITTNDYPPNTRWIVD